MVLIGHDQKLTHALSSVHVKEVEEQQPGIVEALSTNTSHWDKKVMFDLTEADK